MEDLIKVFLPACSQRLGRKSAVDEPATTHHGDFARLTDTTCGFERDMVLLGKRAQEYQSSRKLFAFCFLGLVFVLAFGVSARCSDRMIRWSLLVVAGA